MTERQRTDKRSIAEWIAYLVVVIMVISALAAVLFPVFAPHNRRVSCRDCQSNLRELAVSLQLYRDDYNSTLPSSYLVSHSKRWNKRDYLTFATRLGELPPASDKLPRTLPQILYGHMRNKNIMWCSGDKVSDHPSADSRISCWYKLANDKAWYGEGCTKPCRRESDYKFNASQICFYEHQPWHFQRKGGLWTGMRINVAFVDSHVINIELKNTTSGDPINCAVNSDGEPMYYNYDNKTNKQDAGPGRHTDPQRYSDSL